MKRRVLCILLVFILLSSLFAGGTMEALDFSDRSHIALIVDERTENYREVTEALLDASLEIAKERKLQTDVFYSLSSPDTFALLKSAVNADYDMIVGFFFPLDTFLTLSKEGTGEIFVLVSLLEDEEREGFKVFYLDFPSASFMAGKSAAEKSCASFYGIIVPEMTTLNKMTIESFVEGVKSVVPNASFSVMDQSGSGKAGDSLFFLLSQGAECIFSLSPLEVNHMDPYYVSFSSSINHENGADITVALDYQSLIRQLGEMAGGEEKEKRVLGVEDGVISLSINE